MPESMWTEAWAACLDAPGATARRALQATYGSEPVLLDDRLALLRRVVAAFGARFGNRPLRLFRSPGRINLRGMHVDTHGGYLNLMAHQRETVLAVSPSDSPDSAFANIDPAFEAISFDPSDVALPKSGDWNAFLASDAGQAPTPFARGHWGRYVLGSALRAQHHAGRPMPGLVGLVGSDVPRGAGLSSSAALCVAAVSAFAAHGGAPLAPAELILAARDAEWYAGSRCGVSDQAAMVLGGAGQMVNVALWPEVLDVSSARRLAWPEALTILVIDSRTSRSLSGDAFVRYTLNRFAYSLALEVLREEMRREGFAPDTVERTDRLSRVSPSHVPEWMDARNLYRLLARIAESMRLDELRDRYRLPALDRAYAHYFASLPPEARPTVIPLRGPLLFGIAESERARVFADCIERERFEEAGRLMSIGHDGDRVVGADGRPFAFRADDAALAACAAANLPIAHCAGVYGASSPVLDGIVDAALGAGALGASLTGAGIAGAVLALCRTADAPRVVDAVRAWLASRTYADLAGRAEPLDEHELRSAVTINRATAPAGELLI